MLVIANLMRRFGWTNPVLADSEGVVAGHGRRAAAELIYAAGERIKLPNGDLIPDGTVPVIDCTGWTDAERRAYIIADNQSALRAGWDEDMLRAEMEALREDDFDLGLVGFDQAMLDQFAGIVTPPPPIVDSKFQHTEQFGVIVMCKDAADQEAIFTRLRDEGLEVKVVVT